MRSPLSASGFSLVSPQLAQRVPGMIFRDSVEATGFSDFFDANINVAVCRTAPDAMAKQYIDNLDLEALAEKLKAMGKEPLKPMIFVARCGQDVDGALEEITRAAAPLLPEGEGRDAFLKHLAERAVLFNRITRNPTCSVMLRMLNEGSFGILHRDNHTPFRGIETFRGEATIGAENGLWANGHPTTNNYGLPDLTIETLLQNTVFSGGGNDAANYCGSRGMVVPSQNIHQLAAWDFATWKGDKFPNPWVHMEPAVTGKAHKRLSAIYNMIVG